jgi:5-(carboxyamino)imidazole ribonucleotide mutase
VSKPVVAILMGSKSDLPKLQSCLDTLAEFDIPYTVRVMSAHRTPEVVVDFTTRAADDGYQVIIAAAGMAAHLAGVVAAHTLLPVIGIPVEGGAFQGMDALLATVQMPGGIPVATVAVGKAGAKNAALIAVRILALNDADLAARQQAFAEAQSAAVVAADAELQAELG